MNRLFPTLCAGKTRPFLGSIRSQLDWGKKKRARGSLEAALGSRLSLAGSRDPPGRSRRDVFLFNGVRVGSCACGTAQRGGSARKPLTSAAEPVLKSIAHSP